MAPPIENPAWTPRAEVLTDSDLKRLAELMAHQLQNHPCKFSTVTHEQMDKMARLADFFERVEKKIFDGITYIVLALVGGLLWMLFNHGYFSGIKK